MNERLFIISQIRAASHSRGLSSALQLARAAWDTKQLNAFDVPEVFLALRTGSWRFFDEPVAQSRDHSTPNARSA